MPDLPELIPLIVLLAILALAGFIRGLTGFGAALVAIPVAGAVLGPKTAVATLAIIDFILTMPLVLPAFRRSQFGTVLPAALAALVAVPLGAYILATSDPIALRWALSAFVILMLMLLMSGWHYRGAPKPAMSALAGATSGIFGGIAGMSGPPIVTYWMSGPADKSVLRANLIVFFTFSGISALVSYTLAGLFTLHVLMLALIAAPVFGLAIWLGARLHPRASERQYRSIAFVLIALSAISGLPALDPILRGT